MIHCHFCRATTPNVETAVAADWIPSFYYAGHECETPDPVCPGCQAKFLEQADDGELVCAVDFFGSVTHAAN